MQTSRQAQKAASRRKILDAASRQLRELGPDRVNIHVVMKAAGLTHGAFYAHFRNKDELATKAFTHALETNQPHWFAAADEAATFDERLALLAGSYLSAAHRDNRSHGCAIAALASELENASPDLKASYAEAVTHTVMRIAEGDPDRVPDAMAFLATLTGAINMARNVQDQVLSEQILAAARGPYVSSKQGNIAR